MAHTIPAELPTRPRFITSSSPPTREPRLSAGLLQIPAVLLDGRRATIAWEVLTDYAAPDRSVGLEGGLALVGVKLAHVEVAAHGWVDEALIPSGAEDRALQILEESRDGRAWSEIWEAVERSAS